MKSNQSGKLQKQYSLSWCIRRRWNILDLIQVVGRFAVPTCLFTEINMAFAEKLCTDYSARHGVKTTVTALLLKAVGIAQRGHPETRSALLPWGQTMVINKIVAGFTVEKMVDGQPAVYLGVIENPDIKSLKEIAAELQTYGQKEIEDVPQLALEERFNHMPWLIRRIILLLGLAIPRVRFHYLPASFGLTSIGKYGITALIPPCVSASTFGVGSVDLKPAVVDGQITICPMMTMTLNFDHRLIDGAPASRFFAEVVELIEGDIINYLDDMDTVTDHQSARIPSQPAQIP